MLYAWSGSVCAIRVEPHLNAKTDGYSHFISSTAALFAIAINFPSSTFPSRACCRHADTDESIILPMLTFADLGCDPLAVVLNSGCNRDRNPGRSRPSDSHSTQPREMLISGR